MKNDIVFAIVLIAAFIIGFVSFIAWNNYKEQRDRAATKQMLDDEYMEALKALAKREAEVKNTGKSATELGWAESDLLK